MGAVKGQRYKRPRVYLQRAAYEWIRRKLQSTGEKPWRGCGPLWLREMIHDHANLRLGTKGKPIDMRAFRQAITATYKQVNGNGESAPTPPPLRMVPPAEGASARSIATVLISRVVGMAQDPAKTATLVALEELTRGEGE